MRKKLYEEFKKIFFEVLLNEEKYALGNVPFMLSISWNVFAFKKLL